MHILHILRSRPDDETLKLIAVVSEGNRCHTISLFDETICYNEVLKRVFAAQRVICWW